MSTPTVPARAAGLPRDLPTLTSLRAVAALLVFGYHIGKDTSWLGSAAPLTRYGFVGVAFFFVLSGFVLTWSTAPGLPARDFWAKRVARVYPSHLFMAAVSVVLPVMIMPLTALGAIANVLLVQAWFPQWEVAFSLDAVSWSLSCEAFFYLIAPVVIRRLRSRSTSRATREALAWSVTAAVAALVAGGLGNRVDVWAYTNPLIRSGEFVLGCLLALLVQRGWRPRAGLTLAVVLVTTAGVALSLSAATMTQSRSDVVVTPLFALLILAAALSDVTGRRAGPLRAQWFVYLGQVSFAFYLVHELVIVNVLACVPTPAGRVGGLAMALGTLVVATLAAVALHHGVEKPAQRRVLAAYRRRVGPAGAARSVAADGAPASD